MIRQLRLPFSFRLPATTANGVFARTRWPAGRTHTLAGAHPRLRVSACGRLRPRPVEIRGCHQHSHRPRFCQVRELEHADARGGALARVGAFVPLDSRRHRHGTWRGLAVSRGCPPRRGASRRIVPGFAPSMVASIKTTFSADCIGSSRRKLPVPPSRSSTPSGKTVFSSELTT
mgnify:CR=1 FL=1